MKITVIHHSADFDGIFCREIAKKFLPTAELIGWDYRDEKLWFPDEGLVYILTHDNLTIRKDRGFDGNGNRTIWIDHHKSSIEKFPFHYKGYRIDGVAACRLAYQWFVNQGLEEPDSCPLPDKDSFFNRQVREPLAIRLAGEYDIWDKRDERVDTFQFGLRSRKLDANDWDSLLSESLYSSFVDSLLKDGELLQKYQQSIDIGFMNRSYMLEWEGLKFIALNATRFNSLTFASKDIPETGHDALLGYYFDGTKYNISLYHANHRKDLDLSTIAVRYGGGGHRGACGFNCKTLPF